MGEAMLAEPIDCCLVGESGDTMLFLDVRLLTWRVSKFESEVGVIIVGVCSFYSLLIFCNPIFC